ncbi:MAG: PAS domain S-box protein [Bacteroidetes bacterium]|jgi:PAS domain S-box-containing protein|nr:PAS domain S-box protein [Bacteroidota bacterium]
MTLRRTFYVGLGVVALAVVFVGFTAYATHQQVQAALATGLDVETLFRRANIIIMVGAALGLGVVIGFGVYVQRAVLQPLHALIDGVESLDTARLDQRIDLDRSDELGLLARAIDRMTTSISRRTVSRTYLNNILDSMAEMLFVVDGDGIIRRTNRAARDQLGYGADDLRDTPIDRLLADGPLFTADERATFQRQGFIDHAERTLCPQNGPDVPVLFSRAQVTRSDRASDDIVCVAQDITDRKQAEERLKASLREKEVLLREIHHRVKNNLQIISSLLHLQSKQIEHAAARTLFAESQSRIRSMALIHERLYQSDDLAQVDFAAYLDGLTEHLFRSYNVRRDTIACELQADGGSLSVDRAIPCGLIVNELVANALKHAFPDGRSGTIRVRYAEEDDTAHLIVADDGVGTPEDVEADASDSLGLRLVRGLVQQLDGSLAIARDSGLRFTITFPLTHPTPSDAA